MNEVPEYQFEMKNITKKFGGIAALDDVTFCARPGQVHGLMGENGAGKSTLIKILAGVYEMDQGQIIIGGRKVKINGPRSAKENGVSVIYQEFALAQDLTVAENIFIDHYDKFIQWGSLYEKAKKMLARMGFEDLDVTRKVSEISVAYQQVVEICKALSREAKIIVFDEPTAVLTSKEVDKLFQFITRLREQGTCIIYISHRLEEIFRLCDEITVLKDGKLVGTVPAGGIGEQDLIKMMVGRELKEMFPERKARIGEVVLEALNISVGKRVEDVSFSVRKGEVLGINGLVGAGRTELMRAVFGADKKDSGVIRINQKEVSLTSPKAAVGLKIGMVPEDRKSQGVLLELSVKYNATLSSLGKFTRMMGWIERKKEREAVEEIAGQLRTKIQSIEQPVSDLSGGNQQKVALMKWMIAGCRILILDEPTRGVDVGAKIEIYRIINELAENGAAIIMISSEMPEIIGMCDRVIVLHEGRLSGELEHDEITELNLINLSMGVKRHES